MSVVTHDVILKDKPRRKRRKGIAALRKLRRARYIPATRHDADIPVWIDKALEKATSIARNRRYTLLSEFIHDLAHPNAAFQSRNAEPLIERNPLLVWKGIAALLFILNLLFLYLLTT